MRTALWAVALALAVGCRAVPPAAEDHPVVERARVTMGTELRLTAVSANEAVALGAFDAVFAEFERLESLMSTWRPGTDIVRLNEAAGERPVTISPDVIEVLQIAQQVSEWTSGTFDVTFAALTGLWKFDHDQDNTVPDRDAIRRRLSLINYRDLVVDARNGTAFLRRQEMRVSLGGIGKGYAVDRAAGILRQRGVHNFMIQAGGDLYVGGRRGDQAWRLGIRDPRGPADQVFARLQLSDGTFSTSGDYERAFVKNGRRYHHILDPRSGEPAGLCRSVTLVTAKAVMADALAKGVFILGPVEGMALIERLPGVEGVIVDARNEVTISSGLKDRLTMVQPPTDAP